MLEAVTDPEDAVVRIENALFKPDVTPENNEDEPIIFLLFIILS